MGAEQPLNEKLEKEVEILRKQIAELEKSIRHHEEKEEHLSQLASFPELNPNPVLEIDSTGRLLYLNPAARTLFPDLEPLGVQHSWFQDWNSLVASVEDGLEDSETREVSIGDDWYEQRIYRNRKKKSLRFYGFKVTERKRMENALQESELRVRAVVDDLPVGVWFADESGKILYGNAAGRKIWTGARYIGPEKFQEYKAWWADSGVPLRPDDWAVVRAVRKGETSLNEILEIECFDGTRKVLRNSAVPIRGEGGRLFGVVVLNEDVTEEMRTDEALRHSEARFRLLSETAGRLLATADPQGAVNELCRNAMAFLDCQAFFNFLADDKEGRLHLNAYAGIPEEEAGKIEWLDYGVAVCGCAARDGVRIVATDIFNTPDPRTDLVKTYGIQAYACHPLLVRDRVIGTLSFGTRTRSSFTVEELTLMKTIADQIAIAMERIKFLEDLRRSRDELELKVQERTRDLAKANHELVEQSRILEGFFASTITPIVLLDKDFNFIRVNDAYAKSCAREGSDFQGRNHFELFPDEENQAIFREVVETKRPYRAMAKPFVFPDHPEWGPTYWDWNLTPVLDDEGQVEFLVFSLNDVTEQVKVQEKVRKNEELLRKVLENLPIGVWVTDREGKLVQGNPAGERIWAGSRFRGTMAEQEYTAWHLGSGKKMDSKEWGAVRAVVKGETTLNEEVEIECLDGARKVILNSAVPIRNDRGEVAGAIIVNQDITARKKAEGELRVASRYARSLIEASLDPLVTIGADGRIMDVNRATELATGVNREDLIGSDFSKYFTEPETAREGYRKVFEEGIVRDYQLAIRHIAGGVTDVLYNATLFKNEAGEVQGIFAAARDITEKKKAEEALRESENQLRVLSAQLLSAQENERKRVSRELHDGLQQTLTAIKFKVEAFLLGMSKSRLKEKARTLEPIVSMIQESVREIRRIQANLRPPMLDDLGILAALSWLFREFQGTYPDIRVEKAFQVEERDISEERKMVIYRILQEALTNIGKHSGAEQVSISLRKVENLLELGIRDDGRGFDPQEALSKEQKEKGMGLGSMKERVESSGGLFTVQSQRGKGTLIQASWAL